jgi:hypothetical protein
MRLGSPTLRTAAAVAALVLWPFVYFWRAATGELALLPHDGYRLIYPSKLLAARALSAGELPLWSPYMFSGFPFFAGMQPGVLHPGVWLFCVLPPIAAANLQVILTASVTAVGTYGYLRRIGCMRFAALFSGFTFALGGFMVAHVGHFQMPQGMAVMPWLLWAFESLQETIRLRVVIGAALALTMALFAGYAPGLVYVLLVCGAYVAVAALVGPPSGRVRFLLASGAVVAAGTLGAAVQLLPMLELAALSQRARMDFDYFAQFSLPLAQIPILAFPFLFGDSGSYWGAWNIVELSGYVGIAPLLLSLAAISLMRRNWRVTFWLAVALFSLLVALGPATPLASLMYRVPIYNLVRAQARNLFQVDFAAAVLAAFALTYASRRALVNAALVGSALIAIAAAVASVAGETLWLPIAMAARGEAGGREIVAGLRMANPSIGVPLLATAAAAVGLIGFARYRSALFAALVLAVQLADLDHYGKGLGHQYPSPPWVLSPPQLVGAVEGLPLDGGKARVAVVTKNSEAFDLRPMLWGVPTVNGYDSMPLARYGQFADTMPYWGQIHPAGAFGRPLFLDLLNARWVVVVHPPSASADTEIAEALADRSRWRLERATDGYTVLENLMARPRAWLVSRTAPLAPVNVLRAVREGRLPDTGEPFDPARMALVEEGEARTYGDGAARGEVTIASYAPAAIEMIVRSPASAFLVLSEVDYPGWRAYIDDAEVPIVRTNYVLRGVEVGGGEHRVRMEFTPNSLWVGLVVSACTAAALLIAGVVDWRRNRHGSVARQT